MRFHALAELTFFFASAKQLLALDFNTYSGSLTNLRVNKIIIDRLNGETYYNLRQHVITNCVADDYCKMLQPLLQNASLLQNGAEQTHLHKVHLSNKTLFKKGAGRKSK